MAGHGIVHEHSNYHKYPDFKQLVYGPFEQGRRYDVRPQSEELFDFRFDYYRDGNEESYKHKLLNVIIKDEFAVLLPSADDDENIYGTRRLEYEGIVSKYSARLRSSYLPHALGGKGYDPKLVAKRLQEDGMYTPEPDGIWGFNPAVMPAATFEPKTEEAMTICKKMHWPFFIIQCKLDSLYDETLNQVRRDGAAINNAALLLLRKANYPIDEPGPNRDTFIYSMTMDKKIAQWWVHWTEVEDNGTRLFHMNPVLPGQVIEGTGRLGKLRDPTHAILEWGLNTRMPIVRSRYAAIREGDEEAQRQALKSKDRVAGGSDPVASSSMDTSNKRSWSERDSGGALK